MPLVVYDIIGIQTGTAKDDFLTAVAMEKDGSVVLAGYTGETLATNTSQSADTLSEGFAVVKLDVVGSVLWQWQESAGDSEEDHVAEGMATGEDGSVVVAGYTGSANTANFAAFKLDAGGTLQWKWQGGSSDVGRLHAVSVVAGGSGDVVMAGYEHASSGRGGFIAIKLDSAGEELWRWQDGTNRTEDFIAVATDANGSVVLAGYTDGLRSGEPRGDAGATFYFAAVKLDANGNQIWRWQDGTSEDDRLEAVDIQRDGSIVLAGHTRGNWSGSNAGESDFAYVNLGADGEEIHRWQGGSAGNDHLWAMSAVSDRRVVLAGGIGGSGEEEAVGGYDFMAVMLDTGRPVTPFPIPAILERASTTAPTSSPTLASSTDSTGASNTAAVVVVSVVFLASLACTAMIACFMKCGTSSPAPHTRGGDIAASVNSERQQGAGSNIPHVSNSQRGGIEHNVDRERQQGASSHVSHVSNYQGDGIGLSDTGERQNGTSFHISHAISSQGDGTAPEVERERRQGAVSHTSHGRNYQGSGIAHNIEREHQQVAGSRIPYVLNTQGGSIAFNVDGERQQGAVSHTSHGRNYKGSGIAHNIEREHQQVAGSHIPYVLNTQGGSVAFNVDGERQQGAGSHTSHGINYQGRGIAHNIERDHQQVAGSHIPYVINTQGGGVAFNVDGERQQGAVSHTSHGINYQGCGIAHNMEREHQQVAGSHIPYVVNPEGGGIAFNVDGERQQGAVFHVSHVRNVVEDSPAFRGNHPPSSYQHTPMPANTYARGIVLPPAALAGTEESGKTPISRGGKERSVRLSEKQTVGIPAKASLPATMSDTSVSTIRRGNPAGTGRATGQGAAPRAGCFQPGAGASGLSRSGCVRGPSGGLGLSHAVLEAAQELAQHCQIPGVSGAARVVCILVQLVTNSRDNVIGGEMRLKRCRSIVKMLQRAAEVLGKGGDTVGKEERAIIDDVQDAIFDLVELIQTYRSKNKLSKVFLSKLLKRRQDKLDAVLDQAMSILKLGLQVRVGQDVSAVKEEMVLLKGSISEEKSKSVAEARRARRSQILRQIEIPDGHLTITKELLGKGGFGEVYLADLSGRNAAAKVIRINHGLGRRSSNNALDGGDGGGVNAKREENQRKAFLRELDAMTRLRSPHTVSLYGVVTSLQDRLVLVMELLAGGDLRTLLKHAEQPLPGAQCRQIIRDVCAGMAFVHSKRMIHGDLKSANVLLDGAGRAKIADFGTARWTQDINSTGLVTQTTTSSQNTHRSLPWSAPEVLNAEASTYASDVYSFGIVVWEVLSRELPWATCAHLGDIYIHVVMNGLRPAIPENSPADIAGIAMACWAAAPEQRPNFATIMEIMKHTGWERNDVYRWPATPVE